MIAPRIGLCAEGAPIIGICAFTGLLCAILGWWAPTIIFWLLTIYSCWFFRDPERIVPSGVNLATSPADGRVVRMEKRADPFTGEERVCISVFMNLFSVHVNRSAVAGTVTGIAYHPGKFFNAALDKAADENERCAIQLQDASGGKWCMVQIAGLVARRIVCRAEIGDRLARGERFGLIRFGSRVDLYLPPGYAAAVKIGEYVYGGQSVIARMVSD